MLEGVREWIPVPGSVKARLIQEAVRAFSARGYAGVGVAELARTAGATTGAIYHHFGSKLGLYGVVWDDLERRVLDCMEGAAAAAGTGDGRAAVRAALLVGFDAAVRLEAARLLGEDDPRGVPCPVTALLSRLLAGAPEEPARHARGRLTHGPAAGGGGRGARGRCPPRPGVGAGGGAASRSRRSGRGGPAGPPAPRDE